MYIAKPGLLSLHAIQVLPKHLQCVMIVEVHLLLHVVPLWTASLLSKLVRYCDSCQNYSVSEFVVSEIKKRFIDQTLVLIEVQ